MQLKPHGILLQSMILFVRLTNHHCGKVLMFRFIVNEGKRRKSSSVQGLHSYTDQQRLGLETGAHTSSPPGAIKWVQG